MTFNGKLDLSKADLMKVIDFEEWSRSNSQKEGKIAV
jgi:hypothetical protein